MAETMLGRQVEDGVEDDDGGLSLVKDGAGRKRWRKTSLSTQATSSSMSRYLPDIQGLELLGCWLEQRRSSSRPACHSV